MDAGSQRAADGSLRGGDELKGRRILWVPVVIAAASLALMAVVAAVKDLPIHDPDARYVGSSAALIGVVALIFLAIDVGRRAWILNKSEGTGKAGIGLVLRERWLNRRSLIVLASLASFCCTYIAYRNLKSYVPVITDASYDQPLLDMERWMFLGNDPADLLHDLLGTGAAAEVLSFVYVAFFMFIPLSLGFALIWSNKLRAGVWYAAALSLTWVLGALSYYVLPAMGPVYAAASQFSDLPETGVSRLQDSLLQLRGEVLLDPATATTVQSIAAFVSLHTAIIFAAAVVAHMVGVPKAMRVGLWVLLGLTVTSTVYFGWHYLIDDVGGALVGLLAVWLAARLTGYELSWRREPARARSAQTTSSAT